MVPIWQESKKNESKIVSSLESIENKVYDQIEERLIK
jgi:hypothetical protein